MIVFVMICVKDCVVFNRYHLGSIIKVEVTLRSRLFFKKLHYFCIISDTKRQDSHDFVGVCPVLMGFHSFATVYLRCFGIVSIILKRTGFWYSIDSNVKGG